MSFLTQYLSWGVNSYICCEFSKWKPKLKSREDTEGLRYQWLLMIVLLASWQLDIGHSLRTYLQEAFWILLNIQFIFRNTWLHNNINIWIIFSTFKISMSEKVFFSFSSNCKPISVFHYQVVCKVYSYTSCTLCACCSQSELKILKIQESNARAFILYNCTPNTLRASERSVGCIPTRVGLTVLFLG